MGIKPDKGGTGREAIGCGRAMIERESGGEIGTEGVRFLHCLSTENPPTSWGSRADGVTMDKLSVYIRYRMGQVIDMGSPLEKERWGVSRINVGGLFLTIQAPPLD
ncbi:hypothetical protein GWI33_016848 [Rhynchophorus ferrugineus]|uniref:Uncharacterized protein n=1 Tax=Rhynchophorus ferrugineus TaxID=354439 RepID=A0A834I099_RHYFE|nr:hypothetical protein GWI33_016848 [Rhynchophorus ferrugineus]